MSPERLALSILRDIHASHALRSCRSYDELNEHVDANCLGDVESLPSAGEGEDAVQARCDLIAAAQDMVRTVIGAAPGDLPVMVTVLNDADCHVYVPSGFGFEVHHYNRSDPDPRSLDPHHAALVMAGEHPDYPRFQRID